MVSEAPAWAVYAKPSVTLLTLAVLWTWESIHPLVTRGDGRLVHAGRNVAVSLLNTVVLAVTFSAVTVGVAQLAEVRQWGLLNWGNVATPLRFGLAILLLDFWMYLWHRLNHGIPLLWRSHRMHHADLAMDVTSATRFHLLEQLASAALRLGVILLLGIAMLELLIYETLVVAITMFHHANISLGPLDRPLRWLIVTPRFHQIHHSRIRVETNSNYSVLFSWWDRIFGTHQMRGEDKPVDYGLDQFDQPQWRTLWGMLRMPLEKLEREEMEHGEHGKTR
ncbi:sterol desaturase family protein [Blastopirellula retiformator]|uniref:Fatty acid hydroxylase superfamily protein n=1 Tax=Blastopirellula retiformator TaxID=2527970 RepID=A0A5C5V005_9BACT|nr:sterol desaturase family protein [Blastopirellula retiformator]TWT31708.1 Fatty acid hydroxylase superfamily protein [Blastopirellula retiformator]